MLLHRDRSCLLIVDVQERLVPAMAQSRRVIQNCALLMKAARRLDVPIVATEQYPKGLGPVVVDLREFLPQTGAHAKLAFSCAGDEGAMAAIKAANRRQIVIAGIEAHVCVLQTAFGLKDEGYEVFVAIDCCSSRAEDSVRLAEARLEGAGISVVTLEMVLFEWLGVAGTPEFKEVSALIR